jgi:sporulation protein YlmC with PRC-barrel domain
MKTRLAVTLLATTALLAGTPAFAQRDGAPGNPPSTATGRAADRAQGEVPQPDGTPGNPAGTAAGRALDRAAGSDAGSTSRPATTGSVGPAGAETMPRDGMRASRLVGSNVYSENNESIGEIEELIVSPQGGAAMAVVSVGGFLGIGAKRVAVPFPELRYNTERNRWVLPGATKESLQQRPSFAYNDRDNDRARNPAATGADATTPRSATGGGGGTAAEPGAPRQ